MPMAKSDFQEQLLFIAKRLLRPMVRMFIIYDVHLPRFVCALKQVYIEVAREQIELEGKRQTDSRVMLITGIHRRDVRRLRKSVIPNMWMCRQSLEDRVLHHWKESSAYADTSGQPRPLFSKAQFGNPNFPHLVREVSQDISPRTLLDELLNKGYVERSGKTKVQLKQTEMIAISLRETEWMQEALAVALVYEEQSEELLAKKHQA